MTWLFYFENRIVMSPVIMRLKCTSFSSVKMQFSYLESTSPHSCFNIDFNIFFVCLFALRFNIQGDSFSVMYGQSNPFMGIDHALGSKINVSCIKAQLDATSGYKPRTSIFEALMLDTTRLPAPLI